MITPYILFTATEGELKPPTERHQINQQRIVLLSSPPER